MSAYRRFLPRDGTRTRAYAPAEAAEVAEVQANRRPPTAEALLKSAEAQSRDLRLQQASAGVQQPRTPGIFVLQQPQQLQQETVPIIPELQDGDAISDAGSAPEDLEELPPGIPAEWCEGVLRLGSMRPPRDYPEHAWRQLIIDAERFLDGWAAQAQRLGWPAWELFGCSRHAPWRRVDGMGLLLLLRGKEIAALTQAEALLRNARGARRTYRRKQRDPLHPAERCLVWELA